MDRIYLFIVLKEEYIRLCGEGIKLCACVFIFASDELLCFRRGGLSGIFQDEGMKKDACVRK